MDKRHHLSLQLVKARTNVRRKLRGLQTDLETSQLQFEKRFQPFSEPINKLITEMKHNKLVKQEPSIKHETLHQIASTPAHKSPKTLPSNKHSITQQRSFLFNPDETFEHIPHIESEASQHDKTIDNTSNHQDIEMLSQTPGFQEYLDQWSGLPRQYIEGLVKDVDGSYDTQYGVRHDVNTAKFFIGNAEIDFKDNDFYIKNLLYKGTPGLYELIFKKNPTGYNQADLTQYRDIVERTSANRKQYNPDLQIAGNIGTKYKKIIKDFQKPAPFFQQRPRTGSVPNIRRGSLSAHSKIGKSLRTLSLTDKKVEFVPYKDPNTLIERLQTLVASKLAGNTNNENDINYIVEELKRSKIIKV